MKTTCTDFYGKPHMVETSSLIDHLHAYGIYIVDDEVLLIQDLHSLRWELPGGAIETGETTRQGLTREFVEEAGVAPTGKLHLLREWIEYFFDSTSQQGWRANRTFYVIKNLETGDLLVDGNGIDSASAQMIPIGQLDSLTVMPAIKETILLAYSQHQT
jgi:8-oxo-dGTP pyrophosphatase MutT (NUDIX family)